MNQFECFDCMWGGVVCFVFRWCTQLNAVLAIYRWFLLLNANNWMEWNLLDMTVYSFALIELILSPHPPNWWNIFATWISLSTCVFPRCNNDSRLARWAARVQVLLGHLVVAVLNVLFQVFFFFQLFGFSVLVDILVVVYCFHLTLALIVLHFQLHQCFISLHLECFIELRKIINSAFKCLITETFLNLLPKEELVFSKLWIYENVFFKFQFWETVLYKVLTLSQMIYQNDLLNV